MGSTGKGGGGGSAITQTQGQSQEEQQPKEPSMSYDDFKKLSVSDAADLVGNLPNKRTSDTGGLINSYNDTQKVVEAFNLHGKPVVMSDTDFDKSVATNALGGIEVHRGYSVTDNDGKTIINDLKNGNTTYIGDGIHGEGIYFTTRKRYAKGYAGGQPENTTVTAYIDKKKAKVITETGLMRKYNKLSSSDRRKFGDMSAYALHQGYNVISVPGGNRGSTAAGNASCGDFYVALTRDVLVIRENSKIK